MSAATWSKTGAITVTCEYCSTSYRFAPGEFDPAE